MSDSPPRKQRKTTAAQGLSMTTSAASPLSLLDLNDDVLKCIASFCDAFSLGFLEMSCKKFHSQTLVQDAWEYLDNQISTASKYTYGLESKKTKAARFAVAARLADQVQPAIASHRHIISYYNEDISYNEERNDDSSSQEYCTGCTHIPNQLDVACFSSNSDEEVYAFFLRIFSKSDQRILWQGFMERSILHETIHINFIHLWFQSDFDPSKDFPEFTDVLDAFDDVIGEEEEDDDARKAGEDLFNSVGLIVVAYHELAESATFVSASTELIARRDMEEEEHDNKYMFRGFPESTHSLAPDEGGEGESREDLYTDIQFVAKATRGAPVEDELYTHWNCLPEFVVSYSGDW